MKEVKKDIVVYECSICGKIFYFQHEAIEHEITHNCEHSCYSFLFTEKSIKRVCSMCKKELGAISLADYKKEIEDFYFKLLKLEKKND